MQRLLLNFKRKIMCASDIVHKKETLLWSESSCAHHSVCLMRVSWGDGFYDQLLQFWPFNRNFLTVDFFHDYRLKFGNFYAYRLNVLAVLRRSVNLIENYFVCIKKPRGNWSLVKISIDDNRSKGFFFTLNHFRFRFVSWNFFIYPFILYLLQSYGFNVSSYRLHCT